MQIKLRPPEVQLETSACENKQAGQNKKKNSLSYFGERHYAMDSSVIYGRHLGCGFTVTRAG